MADVTITGLNELRANIQLLEPSLTAELKRIAEATADRIRVGYGQRLDVQLKAGHSGLTAKSAHLIDESLHKQWRVSVPGWTGARPPSDQKKGNRPGNVPLWLEFGTRFMTAKPALRPAAWAEHDRYITDMTRAADDSARALLEF